MGQDQGRYHDRHDTDLIMTLTNNLCAVPSRCTHILYWVNHSVEDLRRAGYIDPIASTALADQLNEVRTSNNFGLSSLPYPYVFTISSMTKFMIIFFIVDEVFRIALIKDAADHTGGWVQEQTEIVCWSLLKLGIKVWMYQALLDLYVLLRNPNQGALSGHMPTPDFLQFTEAVTCGMMIQQDTAPRPFFLDSDEDE
jgi:hypothetical protein